MKEVWILSPDVQVRQSGQLLIDNTFEFFVPQTFRSGEAMLRFLRKNDKTPDIVLTDMILSGMTGIELTSILQKRYPSVKVLVYTDVADDEAVLRAIKSGVAGYLIKDQDQIVLGLQNLARGVIPISNSVVRILFEHLRSNPLSPLTKREKEILEMLAMGKTLRDLSVELFVSFETVKTHIRNIYVKLNVSSKQEAIIVGRKEKYI